MKSEGGTKMKYKVSEKKIYTTTDYSIFIFTDWNRDVSNSRVVKMVESITKVGWLPQPVLVNEKMEIIEFLVIYHKQVSLQLVQQEPQV